MLARDGTLLASLYTERRTVVPFAEIPQHTKLAFLAAEDASFYEHEGSTTWACCARWSSNLRAGRTRARARSTITQQVVKNVLLGAGAHLRAQDQGDDPGAAPRARAVARTRSSRSTSTTSTWGTAATASKRRRRYYFGKKARELDLAEAATLAGTVAVARALLAARRTRRNRAIAPLLRARARCWRRASSRSELWQTARSTRKPILPRARDVRRRVRPRSPEVGHLNARAAPRRLGPSAPRRAAYTVELTIDPGLQAAARKAVRENSWMPSRSATIFRRPSRWRAGKSRLWLMSGTPKPYKAATARVTQADDVAGTLTLELGSERCRPGSVPRSATTRKSTAERVREGRRGAARSLLEHGEGGAPGHLLPRARPRVGARHARRSVARSARAGRELRRATRRARTARPKRRRQPGSLLQAHALQRGALTRGASRPRACSEPRRSRRGKKPGQASAKDGATRRPALRLAVAQEDNDAAAKVLDEVGAPNVVSWARAVGIESALEPTPSLALGAYEVTPSSSRQPTRPSRAAASTTRRASRTRASARRTVTRSRSRRDHRDAASDDAGRGVPDHELLASRASSSSTPTSAQSLGRPVAGKTWAPPGPSQGRVVRGVTSTDFVTEGG